MLETLELLGESMKNYRILVFWLCSLWAPFVFATPSVTWEFVDCSDVERGAEVAYSWKSKGLYETHSKKEVEKVRWVSSDELKLVMYYTYDRSHDSYRSKRQCEEDKETAKKEKENDIFNNPAMLEYLSKSDPKFKELIEKRRALEPQMRELRRIQFEAHMKEQKEKIEHYCQQWGDNAPVGMCGD
jgi:hypothetical protein